MKLFAKWLTIILLVVFTFWISNLMPDPQKFLTALLLVHVFNSVWERRDI